jgi:hypothetical protein
MQVRLEPSTQRSMLKSELDRFGKIASSALLERFESNQGYRDFPETIDTRMSTRASLG